MKLHIYKNTPFGLERVNDRPLTVMEVKSMLKGNPNLTARDAESASYEVLHMPIDWQEEEPTEREKAIAKHFLISLKIALCVSIALFIAEKFLP
jgi:hypothetical protein